MRQDVNRAVQQLLEELVASGAEVGLQVAAYVDGELVVDAWAGLADRAAGVPVAGDTLFTSWSTTKGWAATCLHILADRGRVEYDAPVASYWPEFAANGKGGITVRHILAHTAGLPLLPDDATPELLCDWDALCAALAAMPPLWTPGTQTGYQAWTFGWLVGEIVRRVDGRALARFAQEELCAPLGITGFYLGLPADFAGTVAALEHGPAAAVTAPIPPLRLRAMPESVTSAAVMNRADVRRASIPGAGGLMSARAVARHYALLAERGTLDGVRILAPGRIDLMRSLQTDAEDVVVGRRIRKGMGYQLGGKAEEGAEWEMGTRGGEFGHTGLGGSVGFADPEQRLAFGLTKTLLVDEPDKAKLARTRAAQLIRRLLGRE